MNLSTLIPSAATTIESSVAVTLMVLSDSSVPPPVSPDPAIICLALSAFKFKAVCVASGWIVRGDTVLFPIHQATSFMRGALAKVAYAVGDTDVNYIP